MNLLSVDHATKTYGEKTLFQDVSFIISERERIGVIGINGTGKSTLLRMVAGIEPPDTGTITHAGSFRVEYLPQNPTFDEQITVLHYVFQGDSPIMKALREYEEALFALEARQGDEKLQAKLYAAQSRMEAAHAWDAETQAKSILSRLGVAMYDQPVSSLSGGQKKRVAIARALIQPADLLILDEPTNHVDSETVGWLETMLAKYRGAILLVTHDRYFLDRITNRMFELDRGRLIAYEGNYAAFLEKKAEREEREAASEDKRQNLLRRELAWLKRGAKARTTKQKARIDRVRKLQEQGPQAAGGKLDIAVGGSRLGKKVINLEDVGASGGGRKLFRAFDCIVQQEDRIGIVGPNGCGKSTLLNIMAGRLQPDEGSVETGETVKLAYYTQENAEMDGGKRVIEYVKEAAEAVRTIDGERITAAQMLERFLFPPAQQWTRIDRLSGGERRRLYLLRTLMNEPNVLFLDEPTNDLDIQTLSVLESYLEEFPGVVLTVSHDRYFLDRTVDTLLVFEADGTIRRFEGNYSEWLEKREAERAAEEAERRSVASSVKPAASAAPQAASKPKKLSYKDQKEWDTIESVIAGLEDEVARIKQAVAVSATDYAKVQQLFAEQQAKEAELDAAMERWAELSELVQQIES